jgi:hypothetical protein
MSELASRQSASLDSAVQTEWLERARQLPAPQRVLLVEQTLKALPKMPTSKNIFWRKTLLRLRDSSRLEAGLVSAADLQRENSPFMAFDFSKARISFRSRTRA